MTARLIGVFGNAQFEDMTDEQIELCLMQIDVTGRFDGDIKLLNRVRCPDDSTEGIKILQDLYLRAQAENAQRRLLYAGQQPELLKQIIEQIG